MARRRTLVKKRKSQKLKKSHNNKRRKTYRKMRGGVYSDSIELGLDKVIKYINNLGTLINELRILKICGVKFFVVKSYGRDSLRIDEEYTPPYSDQTGSPVNEIKYSIDDSKLYVKCFFRGKGYFMKPYEFSMEDRDKVIIQNIQNYTDEDYKILTEDNISHNPSDNGNR